MYGWFGKALRVDLGSGKISEEEINGKDLENWIGGRGLGALTIAREVRADCDPLGGENKLVFAAGPLTGTRVSGSGRFSASAKSPLTGTIFDSNSGGTWGVKLKKSGCDMLIVEGRSAVPVYLTIDGDSVHIREAGKLWGADGKPGADTNEIVAILEKVLAKDANHPGANHYYIHALEASPHPEKALAAAGPVIVEAAVDGSGYDNLVARSYK